ncbi:unnamed protein product [Effrenium voratum]|uniref:Uncharacterized protein n=1 Tax=Effrenium voratum TaxID=2562239 RepID=A0AA36I709_9DINO|nr:unnamed protein product [Effrenium voratum]CAJ1421803.1 unnamed protein product [Effrenium voratum]
MATAALLLALAGPALAAPGSFSKLNPGLKAELQLQANSSWHLGGFCFGYGHDGSEVGQLDVHVRWQGRKALGESPVYLAGFQGKDWETAEERWASLSCQEKMALASDTRHLGKSSTQISYFWFPVRIVHGQKRDWHFALLSCGDVEQANLELTVEATEGALSVFQASTSFDESSCPVAPSWLEKASSETVFWGLMVGVALCGSCCVLLVLLGGAWRSRQKPSMKWQQDSELVIGKPCSDAPHADVVEGKTKKSDDLVKAQPEEVDETMPV